MKDSLGPIQQWTSTIADKAGLELDIKEMFLQILRDDIIPALRHIHDQNKGKHIRPVRYIFICREMDVDRWTQ